ncbi:glycosyl hydrolase [Pseudomonas fluorescens]|nr:glycosyl hydrolase [Pseudomonas fluorescens]
MEKIVAPIIAHAEFDTLRGGVCVLPLQVAAAFIIIAALSTSTLAYSAGAPFKDPLDQPAVTSQLATSTPMISLARAGERLVAVGLRGRCLISDDNGSTWIQASVPVSSDLVAVRFINAEKGWAAGHDGVILHTEDGGKTWSRQLDGRMLERMLKQHFERLEEQGEPDAAAYLDEIKLNYQSGPEQAILDLWFEDERNGFAVGTFGTLIATHDGGKTWESWIERADNPSRLHFYSIRGIDGEVYASSERGVVFKLNRKEGRFESINTGYGGGLFGVIGTSRVLIAFGLRGNAYRSLDRGVNWESLKTNVEVGINGAAMLDDRRVVFVTQDGQVLVTTDGGDSFQTFRANRPTLLTDVELTSDGRLLLSGFNGLQSETLR